MIELGQFRVLKTSRKGKGLGYYLYLRYVAHPWIAARPENLFGVWRIKTMSSGTSLDPLPVVSLARDRKNHEYQLVARHGTLRSEGLDCTPLA